MVSTVVPSSKDGFERWSPSKVVPSSAVNPHPKPTPIRDPAGMAAVFPIGERGHRNPLPSTPRTP
ncbi:hypothetical protein HanIR_Chr17g0902661 [Helianthus annuus]|nr:hypothetical protein HanIR_Chr17g0902661 [Helianthus annuus]